MLQHPLTNGDDQPGILGVIDKFARRQQTALRVLPANQQLGTDDPPGTIELRLVIQHELLLANRRAQVAIQLRALGGVTLQDMQEQEEQRHGGNALHPGADDAHVVRQRIEIGGPPVGRGQCNEQQQAEQRHTVTQPQGLIAEGHQRADSHR